MSGHAETKRTVTIDRRIATAALWTTCLVAIASLPRELFPWAWVGAFILPPWLFFALRRGLRLTFARALFVSAAAHATTVLAAQWIAGPIGHETALGCSLLPPMVFLASRREREDSTWALFMAFCIFLIAVILGRAQPTPGPEPVTIWIFVATALVALRSSSSFGSTSRMARAGKQSVTSIGFGPRRLAVGNALSNTLTTLALCMLLMQTFAQFGPDDDERERQRQTRRLAEQSTRSTVGLSDRFEFGESANKIDIQASELLRVSPAAVADAHLPAEIYLRTTHFEIPGLDRWYRARPRDRNIIRVTSLRHRGSVRSDIPIRRIDVDITGPAENFLFLPPGTVAVDGLPRVLGNLRQEEFVRLDQRPVHYTVEFQDHRELAFDRDADPNYSTLADALPSNFAPYRDMFEDLLRRSGVRSSDSPLQIAERVTARMQREMRYELREPEGPWPHTILNFIDGEGVGFCMHYASTLAFCLRLAGVPSRIGVGLYGADPVDDEYVLGSQHAHAWTEIPLEGLGWVVVDPTPAAATSLYGTSGEGRESSASGDAEFLGSGALARWIASPTTLWILAVLLAAFALGALGSRIKPTGNWRTRVRRLAHPVEPDIAHLFASLMRILSKNHPRARGQSLQAYERSLRLRAVEPKLPGDAIAAAFEAYEQVRFGRRAANEQRKELLVAAITQVGAM